MAAVAAAHPGAFVVSYRTAVGAEPIGLSAPEAAAVAFESVAPFRRIRPRRGERNFVGYWWMVTMRRHVMFESWCERDHLVEFDFDPEVVDVAAQPFQLEFPCVDGGRRTRWPDYFLRTADGGGVVVDVKPDQLIDPEGRVKFAASAAMCAEAGWWYRRLGELPTTFSANLRWLAGYRHERVRDATVQARAREVTARSPGLTLQEVTSSLGPPMLVLPTIFHMLWQRELQADLSQWRLSLGTRLYLGSPG